MQSFFTRLGSLFVIAAIAFGAGWFASENAPNKEALKKETGQLAETANLMIDFGDGTIKTYNNITLVEEETIFSLLEKAASLNNFTLQYKDYGGDMGIFLEGINDKRGLGDMWWQVWLNNEYSQTGISTSRVHAGDIIMFKLTKGQE